jgi:hypothetical protein
MITKLPSALAEIRIPSNNIRKIPIETSDMDMGPITPMIINTEERTSIDC